MKKKISIAALLILSGGAELTAAELEQQSAKEASPHKQREAIQLEDVVVRGEAVNSSHCSQQRGHG